jgi:hypothetical protein
MAIGAPASEQRGHGGRQCTITRIVGEPHLALPSEIQRGDARDYDHCQCGTESNPP